MLLTCPRAEKSVTPRVRRSAQRRRTRSHGRTTHANREVRHFNRHGTGRAMLLAILGPEDVSGFDTTDEVGFCNVRSMPGWIFGYDPEQIAVVVDEVGSARSCAHI